MTHAEQMAEQEYPIIRLDNGEDLNESERTAYIKGWEADKWVRVEDGLPVTEEEFGQSDYVLALDDLDSQPVVCWYNSRSKEWIVAHYKADSLPITVTHWQPLPSPPKTK
jgi:hypothetical protein